MSETGDLLDKSDHEIARLRQQVAELEALKIAHLVGNPLKEIEALRQVNLISQQTIDDKNVQIAELTAKLEKAREALEWIDKVNAMATYRRFIMDSEYVRVARQALQELDK